MGNQNNQNDQAATTGADPVERSTALTKFDPETLKGIAPAAAGVQRAVFLPSNFGEALEMAKMLASGIGVRPWCRGNVSACMMIVQQAVRWGMDPYAVANKSYFVNDQVAFESQLVNAVVNTSREIIGRLKIVWEGAGDKLVCRVSGRLAAEPDEVRTLEQKFSTITVKNSPLWKVNVEQQLAYFTTRAWARLYVPEVLLGIYTPDEIVDGKQADMEAKTLPGTAPAPDRRAFDVADAEDAVIEEIEPEKATGDTGKPETCADSQVEPQNGAETAENGQRGAENAENEPQMDLEDTIPAPELPEDDVAWGVWERDQYAEMTACKTVDDLNRVRRESQPVFEHASKAIQKRISDAFTDNVVDLTGK